MPLSDQLEHGDVAMFMPTISCDLGVWAMLASAVAAVSSQRAMPPQSRMRLTLERKFKCMRFNNRRNMIKYT